MKLSIVIPVYNTEPYLDACLASCLKQDVDLSDYELVIVNDGTKDNAMAIAERFAKEYPNITIISQENAGLSAARNAGLVVSKGDYVWFVDSDDCIDKKALSLIFNKIEDKPDVICLQAKRSDTYVLRNVFSGNVSNGHDVLLHDFSDWDRCVPYFVFNRQFLDKKYNVRPEKVTWFVSLYADYGVLNINSAPADAGETFYYKQTDEGVKYYVTPLLLSKPAYNEKFNNFTIGVKFTVLLQLPIAPKQFIYDGSKNTRDWKRGGTQAIK